MPKQRNPRSQTEGPAESRRQALTGTNSSSRLGQVLERLEGVRRSGKGYSARCPSHHDKTPSLSITEGRDGRTLLYCFAGCEPEAIANAIGLSMSDLFADTPFHRSPPPRRHPVPRRVAQSLQERPDFVFEWELVKVLASVPEPLAARDLLLSWDHLADRVDIPFVVALSRLVREALA